MEPRNQITLVTGRVQYYDSQGNLPAIVFIHGNSRSAETFLPQFQSSLVKNYRLIALDLPGHGHSPPKQDSTVLYSVPYYRKVVLQLIEKLRLENPILVGHSLGGHIALEAALDAGAGGLLISGTPPLGKPPDLGRAFLPNPAFGLFFKANPTQEETTVAVSQLLAENSPNVALLKALSDDLRNTDPRVRDELGQSIGRQELGNEAEIIRTLPMPVAILHGELDRLVSLDYLQSLSIPSLWKQKVQILKNASHLIHNENAEQYNQLLEEFAGSCVGP